VTLVISASALKRMWERNETDCCICRGALSRRRARGLRWRESDVLGTI
jgi:hypothetical protein